MITKEIGFRIHQINANNLQCRNNGFTLSLKYEKKSDDSEYLDHNITSNQLQMYKNLNSSFFVLGPYRKMQILPDKLIY